mgnify:FL=1
MQIYCPKCKTAYQIDDGLIDEVRKVRCANCHEIFNPQDFRVSVNLQVEAIDDEIEVSAARTVERELPAEPDLPAAGENEGEVSETPVVPQSEKSDDLKEMFARLSTQTEEIFAAEAAIPGYKKAWHQVRDFFGLNQRRNYKYYFFLLALMFLLALYNWRYEIVRHAAFMEYAYNAVGIKSRIPGEGLEFQNVTRREFEKDDINHMEVKGFIVNATDRQIDIPTIHLELLNRDAEFIEEKDITPPANSVQPNGNIAFNIIIAKPSSLTKYIYLTFIDKEK